MSVKMVLFDLDGTLLPMDQDIFVKYYFGKLAAKLAPHGYESKSLIDGIWAGTAAMVKNTGETSYEAAFWNDFASRFGEQVREDMPLFEDFYANDFEEAKKSCGFQPMAAEVIAKIKSAGCRVALATNPIFPAVATRKRIRWAGLTPEDFELYTTYENSCHCKPNPAYYEDVVRELGVSPEDCLMVGNDVGEDMIAEQLGMKVFLVTDCIINKQNKDISAYPHGGFPELVQFLDTLLAE